MNGRGNKGSRAKTPRRKDKSKKTIIGHRHTQTYTEILTEVFSCEVRRTKGVIALRKETNDISSVCEISCLM